MTTFRRCLLVLCLLAVAQTRSTALTPLPPNPHQFLNVETTCADCHNYYNGSLEPHEFVVEIPEKCWECHSKEKLGRSHPIGVDPSRTPHTVEVPEEIPLENGLVSCGSCHNPHRDYLSKITSYKEQPAKFIQVDGRTEIPWYKTLYLRKSDPIKGFEPLCVACHTDY